MRQHMADNGSVDWDSAIARAREYAPFLARGLERMPDLAGLLAHGDGEAAIKWAKQAGEDAPDLGTALRRERVALSVALGIGDLAGAFPLERVMRELSDCADRALHRAIIQVIDDRVEGAKPIGFYALALGKQGAHELNYSSDIDPILLYDPETLPCRERDDPGDAAQRYARGIVKLLTENTADGFVFRVDLRLRPASEISPLAVPSGAAWAHYESAALAWERAAFIRSRAAAGDIAAGEAFLERIKPFVWRSALDFGAVEEIRRLTAQIRLNYDGPQRPGPGFDIKRGRGGIREIEFYAQTHQLIHGGRDASLRVKGTRDALDALAASSWIDGGTAQMLGESYHRLRMIEHRLQMVNDRQTHVLPQGDALDAVARLDGLADGAALVAELEGITDRVGAAYDALIGDAVSATPPEPVTPQKPELAERLGDLGFADPDELALRISAWRDGRYQCLRSNEALAAFDALQPKLVAALAQADDAPRALTRWESLLAGAPSAINLFHLLSARPRLLQQLVGTLTLSP
ncbi:MAG: glutamine-synthetase adenylyltransferase, partial [Pseudomonadota bacterium]